MRALAKKAAQGSGEVPPCRKFPEPVDKLAVREGSRYAYFGDLHVHTAYSMDAFQFGTLATPDDAYRYAKGEAIKHPAGFDMQLERPLIFMRSPITAFTSAWSGQGRIPQRKSLGIRRCSRSTT